jgi:hypothetical protein
MREAGCGAVRLRDARVGVGRLWDFCSDPRDCKERVGDRREDGRSEMRRRAAAGCERGVAAWKERRSRDARGGEDGRSGGAGGCMEGAEERLRGWKERGGCGAARLGRLRVYAGCGMRARQNVRHQKLDAYTPYIISSRDFV